MPIRPPALDDRGFDDLVEEILARIPAHTPEWTNPRLGDPGRTLIELFAWLTDTLLYRANLIPERQRLAFLRLLGVQMRPAVAARGLVSLSLDDPKASQAVYLQPLARLKGPATFETLSELTVLPVTAEAYYKRALSEAEAAEVADVLVGLQEIYQLTGQALPYITTPIFAGGAPEVGGFDLIERTVDKCLWLALLAPDPELVDEVKASLGTNPNGGQQLISIGVMPSIAVPALFEDLGPRARIPSVWEITSVNARGELDYLTLDVIADSTAGLAQRGVVRLALPAPRLIGAPSNDVRRALDAGVGDRPPRLDIPETADRLVAWLRLRPLIGVQRMPLSWIGINAVEIDQRETVIGRVIGQSDGSTDQELPLPGQSIQPETLQIQVEEAGRGYQPWQPIDDLALAGRDAPVFSLDSEAGTLRFGDGVRGRIPEAGRRVRAARLRAGGGRVGNLPPGALTEISARDLTGAPTPKLAVRQSLPTEGGEEAETLAEAERRIPALFRHRDRAVTADDYRRLAADTPGIRLGRVEVLSRFKPQQRRSGVPGVVSVMVLPAKADPSPPNPRADRPILEAVQAYLDARRPLATELYVIGCEYIPVGISASLTIRDGFGRDGVLNATREALRRFLWPLSPGGTDRAGWPLGKPVRDRELEVVIAQVPGVNSVQGVNLFERRTDTWRQIPRPDACAPVELTLAAWQLPELLTVIVAADDAPPTDLSRAPNPFAGPADQAVAVPVVRKVC